LLSRGYVCSVDNRRSLSVLGGMIINVHMFRVLVHFRSADKLDAGLVIRIERSRVRYRITDFSEEVLNPNNLACGGPCCNVFSFCRTCSYNSLFLRAPYHRAAIEEYDIACSRFAIGEVGCKVGIAICHGLVRVCCLGVA
jgi:hypothetical protein